MLVERLDARRKDFRGVELKLGLTDIIAEVTGNEQLEEGIRATTTGRILAELQLAGASTWESAGCGLRAPSERRRSSRSHRARGADPGEGSARVHQRRDRAGPAEQHSDGRLDAWMHGDAYAASDTSPYPGPTTANVDVRRFDNEGILPGLSAAFAFDSKGSIITLRFKNQDDRRRSRRSSHPHGQREYRHSARETGKTVAKTLIKTGDVTAALKAVFLQEFPAARISTSTIATARSFPVPTTRFASIQTTPKFGLERGQKFHEQDAWRSHGTHACLARCGRRRPTGNITHEQPAR